MCEDGIEESVPHDHRLSSLGKQRDANRWSLGRNLYHNLTLKILRESPQQFKDRIMPWMYGRALRIVQLPKSSILFARTGVWKISSVVCGLSSI